MNKLDEEINVKEIREKLGYSQEEFAEKLGVSRNTIYNYEKGGKIPESKKAQLKNFRNLSKLGDPPTNPKALEKYEAEALGEINEMQVIDYVTEHFDDLMKNDRFAQFIENIELRAQLKFVKDQANKS